MEGVFAIFNERFKLDITNYGGRVMRWKVDGIDIVFGFDSIDEYKKASEPYHSALIGRYANRIANAKYFSNGNPCQLNNNLGTHMLHGGSNAFHNVIWTVLSRSQTHLELQYISKDGDQGFPGELITIAKYSIVDDGVLLEINASTSKPTPVSLTHHPYFNLSGLSSNNLKQHRFKIHSNSILPTDQEGIPLGYELNIKDTAFDFRNWKTLQRSFQEKHDQIELLGGVDHSYTFDTLRDDLVLQAEAKSDESNIHMQVYSNQPAIQFYTANHFAGKDQGKDHRIHAYRGAFCFEPQQWPDSPNRSNFPSTMLDPNEEFTFAMKYSFPVR